MSISFPTVCRLIDSFKERCRLNGWETCENEDWVKTKDGQYHSLLWTQTIHPSTFARIVTSHKCGIRHLTFYEVVDVAYTCWLFHENVPELLIDWLEDNPELSEKTAIFDFSCIYRGSNVCRKFNKTRSRVFKEFERFLEEEWNIRFKPTDELPALTT